MNNKDENLEWEKEAAYLARLPKTTPYRVPDGYFNDLQTHINLAIFLDGVKHSEDEPFKVPTNYFEDLANQVEARIATSNLKALVAQEGFQTPINYFDQLQHKIIDHTYGEASKTKVVKLWHREAMKYVSAACLFIIVATGLYLRQQHEVKQIASAELAREQVLYDIDENVIFEHIEESQTAGTTATPAEMENYILDNFSSSDLANNL